MGVHVHSEAVPVHLLVHVHVNGYVNANGYKYVQTGTGRTDQEKVGGPAER